MPYLRRGGRATADPTNFKSMAESTARLAWLPSLLLILNGCASETWPVLFPAGPITLAERNLLFGAIALMLIVVIPVFAMTGWFVWRYRASRSGDAYAPDWTYSGKIDAFIWGVPAIIVLVLGILVWAYTHKLDPYRDDGAGEATHVQAIALDWKWLFIYPEYGVASVNKLVMPVGDPSISRSRPIRR